MMLKTKVVRPAIAMLELIFAIVIMGIIMMSAPMLISTATKSGYVAIQQEAINEAASQVNMIMGYHWDEGNTNENYIPPILITSGDSELNEVNISAEPTGRRLGTPEESYRTFIRSDGQRFTTSSIGLDTGETGNHDEDDIDDFSGTSTSLTFISEPTLETNVANYVETTTINIARDINYSSDAANYNQPSITFDPFAAPGGITNIKSITVTLSSTSGQDELEKNIVLRGFSCNIGGYKLEERDF